MKERHKNILFYTGLPRAFRSTLIGELYEISQKYPVYLLAEKLDPKIEKLLSDKKIFPKIVEIIKVNACGNIFSQNKYFSRIAKNIFDTNLFDAIILPSDIYPIFELYLMRVARKRKILKIAIQSSCILESSKISKWIDLTNAYLRFSNVLPLYLRTFLVKIRKYLGHIAYYFVLPLSIGQLPFLGKSSYILKKGISGMRDTDYQTAFSKRDYEIYLKEGVKEEKVYILKHPLTRKNAQNLFQIINPKQENKNDKAMVVFLPSEIKLGFTKANFQLISFSDRKEIWTGIIKEIINIFPDYNIYLKPHPDTDNFNEIKKCFDGFPPNLKLLNPNDPADEFITLSEIIIGLPPSASTTLLSASLQCPEKLILSLDTENEFYGDFYVNFRGIEYINSKDKFKEVLKLVRSNNYQKNKFLKEGNKKEYKEFKNSVEMLDKLLKV